MEEKFYTVQEIADMWGMHRSTITNLILKQKLAATVVGKQYRISESQLKDYIEANTIKRKEA